MNMTPKEVELTLRDLNAGILRVLVHITTTAVLDLKGGPKMAQATEPVFWLAGIAHDMEGPYGKDKIPAPPEVKVKSNAVVAKFAEDLQRYCEEIFTKDQ